MRNYFLDIDILETVPYATNSHRATSYRYNFKAIKSEGMECIDFMAFEIKDKKFNFNAFHCILPQALRWLMRHHLQGRCCHLQRS